LSNQFSIQRSGLPGTGSSVPCSPTGDGAAISHSAPLEDQTSSFAPLDGHQVPIPGLDSPTWEVTPRPGDGEHWSPPEPVGGHSGFGAEPHYPDCIAQSYTGTPADRGPSSPAWELGLQGHFAAPPAPVEIADPEILLRGIPEGLQLSFPCPSWAVVGECEEGHQHAKELICNREWCRGCGGDQGKAHQRRKASWLPKATRMAQMGYFVITFAPELRGEKDDPEFRNDARNPAYLSAKGSAFTRMFKRHGFERGLRRWHWFGEDHPGHGLQRDGLPVYHPHLNVLVEAGHLSKRKLRAIRKSVAKIQRVALDRVNVHYQYARNTTEMLHLVKYCLRPTFEEWEWDEQLAYRLRGIRNAVTWGRWKVDGRWIDEPVWSVPAGESGRVVGPLEDGHCPLDGSTITWKGIVSTRLVKDPWWTEVGGGYWSHNGLARDGPPQLRVSPRPATISNRDPRTSAV